ncbi:hypothetical protein [Burkholderia aenigmatica]|uniref:hypothetical protein n=1 Tax=Burkholderia aenigmatica TaxID=2015348 RepID=UPI0026510B0C|nr:hypothetical protein [Burkholderia aenigmatica]MDN7880106.1 hypothetical protein [Burkholderia aenigmatica]
MSFSHCPVVPRADISCRLSPEVVALDLAFNVGLRWHNMPGEWTERVMDHVGGTRGLHRCFLTWADDFLRHWDGLTATERQEYEFELELYVTASLDELASKVGATVLSSALAS